MVTRVGHVSLRVPDVDASSEFMQDVLGMSESERGDGRVYLTCNERHHELILSAGGRKAEYEHIGMEVADDAALEQTLRAAEAAGGTRLGTVDGEPGIAGGALVRGPGGHVFKLFHTMAIGQPTEASSIADVRALRSEHFSLNVRNRPAMERFLQDGLGMQLTDRIGKNGAWFRCEEIHHGIALVQTPKNGLAHYAFSLEDFDALRRVADRLHERGRKLAWGPGRHGPGNNLFIYFFDAAGALVECCADMARVGPGHPYEPRTWKLRPGNISLWGGFPPPRFLAADTPVASG